MVEENLYGEAEEGQGKEEKSVEEKLAELTSQVTNLNSALAQERKEKQDLRRKLDASNIINRRAAPGAAPAPRTIADEVAEMKRANRALVESVQEMQLRMVTGKDGPSYDQVFHVVEKDY